MNREIFMKELGRLLTDIPAREREEAIQYYEEYFNDAGPDREAGVLADLGSPAFVAQKIKEGLFGTTVEPGQDCAAPKKSPLKTVGFVILCIFASPFLLTFAAVLLSLIAAVFAVLIGLIVGFGASALALLISCMVLVVVGCFNAFSVPFVALILGGCGLFVGGIGILFMMLTVWLCAYALPGICKGIGWMFGKMFGKEKSA